VNNWLIDEDKLFFLVQPDWNSNPPSYSLEAGTLLLY